MKIAVALGMAAMCLAAKAQVACTMPNGRTITLNLTHICPAGATTAKSLDGQPVSIGPPASATADSAPPPASKAPSAAAKATANQTTTQSDGSRVVSRASAAGCINRDVYDQLTKIAVQGDSEAFTRALGGSIITGQCIVFKRGDVVFVDDTALFSGLVRLRPQGQIRTYWTAMETISTK